MVECVDGNGDKKEINSGCGLFNEVWREYCFIYQFTLYS